MVLGAGVEAAAGAAVVAHAADAARGHGVASCPRLPALRGAPAGRDSGSEPSAAASVAVGAGLCLWQPAVTFPSGNGEWTLGPDADPLQPAFVPEFPYRHLGT